MADDNIKTYSVEPGGNIQLESLPPEVKNAALGRYMDAFSRLEGIIHYTTSEILQIGYQTLSSMFAVLMTKQSIDLLNAVAQEHLTDDGATRVRKICERLGRRNMRRNHIVHGRWTQVVTLTDEGATQQWVRSYQHVSPAMRKLPHTDPKVAGMYSFTIPEIDRATDHVEEMGVELSALCDDLPSLRPPPLPHEASLGG